MSFENTPQVQFLTKIPETPLLDDVGKKMAMGLDDLINNKIIGGLGEKFDEWTAIARQAGKGGINLGGSELAGGLNTAPALSPSKSPDVTEKGLGQQIARERVPERVREISAAAVGEQGRAMECKNCSEQDLGNFSPLVNNAIAKDLGQGRGGVGI